MHGDAIGFRLGDSVQTFGMLCRVISLWPAEFDCDIGAFNHVLLARLAVELGVAVAHASDDVDENLLLAVAGSRSLCAAGVTPPKVAAVERAIAKLTATEGPAASRPTTDTALRLDTGTMAQMRAAADCLGDRPHKAHDLSQKGEAAVLAALPARFQCVIVAG